MNEIPLVDLIAQYQGIKDEINAAILGVINSGSFVLGKELEEFEGKFAKYLKVKYCVGVASGTDALILSLKSLGVGAGDEVISTPMTFVSTAEAIAVCGARPVFVDIDYKTGNIDPNQIEKAVNKKTKVIIPVHLYGMPAEMDQILRIAKINKLKVVEDAAQAHGALYKGKNAGTMGEMGIFSFYPSKNLGAYGDAGCIVTNRCKLAEEVGLLRNHGRRDKYVHEKLGYGSRLDNLQAAILLVKLRHIEKWTESRRRIAEKYKVLLEQAGLDLFYEPGQVKHVYHIYPVKVDRKRDMILERLKKKGVYCGIHYPIPLHLQPAFKYLKYRKGDFPMSEKFASNVLSLPIYPEMTDEQVETVARYLLQSIRHGA